jgi:very-short-patch-repair endonuclease
MRYEIPLPLREGVGGGVITNRAAQLRSNATNPERLLWAQLRRKRIFGVRFRRQFRIGVYFVDFVCLPARLVVEVDGGQHDVRRAYDERRTAWLNSQQFDVLRFWNNEVTGNIEGVVDTIKRRVIERLRDHPSPYPLPQGEGN